nr:amidohydrolase family protein [Propionibacterium sp.]
MTAPLTPAPQRLLVRGARLVPLDGEAPGAPVDLRLADGVMCEVGEALTPAGEPVLEAGGRWVIPGLWDAHLHLAAHASRRGWFDLASTDGPDAAVARVAAHLAARPGEVAGGVATGFGYRSNAWSAPASVAALDAVSGDRPVVLVAGDFHNGWLNSAAQRLLGVGPFAGALFEEEWFSVADRLGGVPGFAAGQEDVRAVLADAAARGLTGVVDFDFNALADWPRRVAAGLDLLRVRVGVYGPHLDDVIAAGLRTGDALDDRGLVTLGAHKIIADGSLGSRTAWCWEPYADGVPGMPAAAGAPNLPVARLRDQAARATAAGLEVALHAIGDRTVTVALDAVEACGARGSIEHAQLLTAADLGRFARLGVRASVQPLHLVDDRDLADVCWAGRTGRCYAFRALLDAGADLRFGSDAPVAPIDPWGAMAAAVHRSGDDRPAWHPEQAVTPAEAVRASVDGQRLRRGARADLVVLGEDPLWRGATPAETAAHLRTMPVLATVCAGRITHLGAPLLRKGGS